MIKTYFYSFIILCLIKSVYFTNMQFESSMHIFINIIHALQVI